VFVTTIRTHCNRLAFLLHEITSIHANKDGWMDGCNMTTDV